MQEYLSGSKLYGDDFNSEQIAQWFEDESEAYYRLASTYYDIFSEGNTSYQYEYHQINYQHGFKSFFKKGLNDIKVLGVGSAYGCELEPIANFCNSITILEPSSSFIRSDILGAPVHYIKPATSGELPFDDDAFDLITCFGVLHHIPNVSKVMSELYRCTKPGGVVLLREPIISMGDWRKPRKGLTTHERGIPLKIFHSIFSNVGFEIVKEYKCFHTLTQKIATIFPAASFNDKTTVILDQILSQLPIWSPRYHPQNLLDKLRPTSAFFYLQKN